VSVPNPAGGHGKRYTIGTYRLKADADAAEREAQDAIRRGTFDPAPPAPPKVTTVADAVNVWFTTKRNSIQPNSATGYESAIRLHVVPALGGEDIATLTHDDVQRVVNRWRDGGMGARLLQRCVMILRAALAREVKIGVIPHNVADGIQKPSARGRKPFTVWSGPQIDAFLTVAVQDERLAPFWYLTLVEGMRRGEALGLRWADLHWSLDESACTAVVSQTVVPDLARGGAALIQPRAKTRSSQRSVQLTRPTVAVLKAHRDRQRFQRQALADVWGDHDLICTTSIGTPVTPSSIKRNLHGLVASAGVPAVTTHGLRHMAATIMLRAGVSPALVALKLGHADIGTTVDRYGHLAVSDQAAANAALEAAIQGSGTAG
jgi:integrase